MYVAARLFRANVAIHRSLCLYLYGKGQAGHTSDIRRVVKTLVQQWDSSGQRSPPADMVACLRQALQSFDEHVDTTLQTGAEYVADALASSSVCSSYEWLPLFCAALVDALRIYPDLLCDTRVAGRLTCSRGKVLDVLVDVWMSVIMTLIRPTD